MDDGRCLDLSRRAADENGLKPGLALSETRLGALLAEDDFSDAMDKSRRFIGFRPRSEAEVRRYLRRRGHPEDVVERVVARLRELKELDDAAFARFWVENRVVFRPRSSRLMRSELRQKGIPSGLAEKTVEGVDDESAAIEIGRRRASRLSRLEWADFRKRMGAYLQRREFSYETIDRVIRLLWEERTGRDPF